MWKQRMLYPFRSMARGLTLSKLTFNSFGTTPGDSNRRRARGRMYGMLFESIEYFVKQDYGLDVWTAVLQHAGLGHVIFIAQKTYPDEWMVNLAKATKTVTRAATVDDVMFYFGTCFVNYCRKFSYDAILRLAGRTYRDFLNEIDNIHETIRFSHPKMQSPSFIVQSEDRHGCVLVYRSMRRGFTHYVKGQLMQCAQLFYKVEVVIEILEEITTEQGCHVTFRLIFDNQAYKPPTGSGHTASCDLADYPSVKSSTFFKLFPFCLVFNPKMKIIGCGGNLASLLQGYQLLGASVTDMFSLRRPLVDFTWANIMSLQRVIFELALRRVGSRDTAPGFSGQANSGTSGQLDTKKCVGARKVLLRGQMKYIKDWNAMAFLCTPLLGNLDDMSKTGLYLHDLNMFDNSRELVLTGHRCASDLEYSMEKQTAWTKQIEETLSKLNQARQRSDDLINSMLTKSIADRLKRGDNSVDTCETIPSVTILFSYLIGFSDICVGGTPMQVVECIQNATEVFDKIVDKYKLFKVETLGDGVYMVAGGVPDRCDDHALKVAGLALELVENAQYVKNPVSGCGMQIQIGMHTGSVVAGIVGKRTPQYCLVGDTVNTAARMQTNSQPGQIHLTQPCHECLKGTGFVTVFRGRIQLKGKGQVKAYWLIGKADDPATLTVCRILQEEHLQRQQRSENNPPDISRSGSNFSIAATLSAEDEKEFEETMQAALHMGESSTSVTQGHQAVSQTRPQNNLDSSTHGSNSNSIACPCNDIDTTTTSLTFSTTTTSAAVVSNPVLTKTCLNPITINPVCTTATSSPTVDSGHLSTSRPQDNSRRDAFSTSHPQDNRGRDTKSTRRHNLCLPSVLISCGSCQNSSAMNTKGNLTNCNTDHDPDSDSTAVGQSDSLGSQMTQRPDTAGAP